MKMMMLLSIVIPTRNRPGYLERCLVAIHHTLGDDAQRVAIHVIDDGSGEGAGIRNAALCEQYGATCHHLPRNRGMSVARSTGARACDSEWIAFIDDDIVVDEQWYREVRRTLDGAGREVVGIEGLVNGSGRGVWDREVENLSGGLYLTCHIIYRGSALDDAGGFDEHFEFEGPFHEDHELAARMLQFGSIPFSAGICATHLPRTVHPLRYIGDSPKRMWQLLNAEMYFYLKQKDQYHRFRHYATFWGTYLAITTRHVYSTLHRRSLVKLLCRPVQTAVLLFATCIEQAVAVLMLPRLLRRYLSEAPPTLSPLVDAQATAARWGLDARGVPLRLQLRRPFHRLASFALWRRPVYDAAASLRALRRELPSSLPQRFFLRIDDVFLSQQSKFERLVRILGDLHTPYLGAVTGDDLCGPLATHAVSALRQSGGEIGVHGFSHTGKFGPFASEIMQLSLPELMARIEQVRVFLAKNSIVPLAFVPPFNAINALKIDFLSRIFAVVCGGPESARFTQRLAGPLVLKSGGIYFPSFFPFYADGRTIFKAVRRYEAVLCGDICLTVHMPAEGDDDYGSLKRLVASVGDRIYPWTVLVSREESRA